MGFNQQKILNYWYSRGFNPQEMVVCFCEDMLRYVGIHNIYIYNIFLKRWCTLSLEIPWIFLGLAAMKPWKFAGDTEDRKAGMDKQQKRKFHGSIYIYIYRPVHNVSVFI